MDLPATDIVPESLLDEQVLFTTPDDECLCTFRDFLAGLGANALDIDDIVIRLTGGRIYEGVGWSLRQLTAAELEAYHQRPFNLILGAIAVCVALRQYHLSLMGTGAGMFTPAMALATGLVNEADSRCTGLLRALGADLPYKVFRDICDALQAGNQPAARRLLREALADLPETPFDIGGRLLALEARYKAAVKGRISLLVDHGGRVGLGAHIAEGETRFPFGLAFTEGYAVAADAFEAFDLLLSLHEARGIHRPI